jgi:hypothetical protein
MGRRKLINADNTKTCKQCKQDKQLSDYYINTSGWYLPRCKTCHSAFVIQSRDSSKFNKYRKLYTKKNKEKVNKWDETSKVRRNEYYKSVSGMTASQVYKFRSESRMTDEDRQRKSELNKMRSKFYRIKNKNQIRKRQAEYYKANRDRLLKKQNERNKIKCGIKLTETVN